MKISTSDLRGRGPLVALTLIVAAGTAACGGTSPSSAAPSNASNPSPDGTSTSTAPVSPPAPTSSSAAAVPKVKPVPVEQNPPGDIPDNLAFVKYVNKPGGYSFTHPEGWAQTGNGTQVRFTDKLNGVTVDSSRANQAPTVATARAHDVPRLKGMIPAFELRSVSAVTLPGGSGVHLVFRRNSEPDQVTGKVFRDEVEEYAVQSHGRLIRMDLYGPVGADNVDAYRTMSQSLAVR